MTERSEESPASWRARHLLLELSVPILGVATGIGLGALMGIPAGQGLVFLVIPVLIHGYRTIKRLYY